jgi:hypothetical protein
MSLWSLGKRGCDWVSWFHQDGANRAEVPVHVQTVSDYRRAEAVIFIDA